MGVWSTWICSVFVFVLTEQGTVRNLTSPQDSNPMLQHVGLAGLALSWILVDYCQILIPVTPVNRIHPDMTRRHWDWWFYLKWHWCRWVTVIMNNAKYLKHQRRSGVPSQFFPTVTISPARNDLRRQTGNERSMSKIVVAHCEYTVFKNI